MIPILGETVLSIMHGPATTGHLVEVSQFLKRPIDVWAEDRLLLFCQCYNRQKPRLHLKYKSLTNKCPSCKSSSSSKAVGHFTLLQGHEPRNPDARSHPENCGFDVISDQTGYPATALRQVAVQRMLAKLYESRLRGRDHRFQCSHCSVSGGWNWDKIAQEMIDKSKNEHNGHAHLHVFNQDCEPRCQCPTEYVDDNQNVPNYKVINCIKKYDYLKKQYDEKKKKEKSNVDVHKLSTATENPITVFDNDKDLKTCLVLLLEKYFHAARKCICMNDKKKCIAKNITKNENKMNHSRKITGTVSDNIPKTLGLGMARRYIREPITRFVEFQVERAEAVFKCIVREKKPSTGIPVAENANYLILVSTYPVWQKSNQDRDYNDQSKWFLTQAPNNSQDTSASEQQASQGSSSSSSKSTEEKWEIYAKKKCKKRN